MLNFNYNLALLESKRQKYLTFYKHVLNIFDPHKPLERDYVVRARSVIYHLELLKGIELLNYIKELESLIDTMLQRRSYERSL